MSQEIVQRASKLTAGQAVMAFVPSPADASAVSRHLRRAWKGATGVPTVFEYHGRVSVSDRRQALESTAPKVILATAVARAGVTPGSCSLVLSAGTTKQTVIDSETRRSQLVRRATTERELVQEAGRAGRVGDSRHQLCAHVVFSVPALLQVELAACADASGLAGNSALYGVHARLDPPLAHHVVLATEELRDSIQQLDAYLEALRKEVQAATQLRPIPWHTEPGRSSGDAVGSRSVECLEERRGSR